jgi:hypothetical protein
MTAMEKPAKKLTKDFQKDEERAQQQKNSVVQY